MKWDVSALKKTLLLLLFTSSSGRLDGIWSDAPSPTLGTLGALRLDLFSEAFRSLRREGELLHSIARSLAGGFIHISSC